MSANNPPIPRQSDTPRPGHYILKLVRNGPWVGAQIVHADGQWQVMIDGTWQGPSADPWLLPNMERVHWYATETDEADVKYRIGLKRYSEIYRPDAPEANPTKPVDLNKLVPF